jgi:hypothetical protein
MPWGRPNVAALTLDACREANLAVSLLPEWYDVDDAGGLAQLYEDLAGEPASVATHTRRALADPAIPVMDRHLGFMGARFATGSSA